MMCQADDGNLGEDGVAPEGALHLSEGNGANWLSIDTFPDQDDDRLNDGAVLWNTCDGVHLVHPTDMCNPHWVDLLFNDPEELRRTFSHWMPVFPPCRPIEEATSVADTVPAASEQGESPDGDRAVVNEAAGASSPFGLPSLSQEFTPCAIELDEARITEMVLKDCFMIWEPWGNDGVEFGYDAEGSLQAIRIPDLVAGHKVLRERDTRPKDGDPQGAPLASSRVPEGNSPDDPAANKSASLTPQNYEAKAREIIDPYLTDAPEGYLIDFYAATAAISSAISSAVQAERERIRGMLVSKADALAIEAQIPGDPSRTAILMAKGQAYAEASSLLSAVSDADVEEGIRIAREIRPAIEAEIASAIRKEDATNG